MQFYLLVTKNVSGARALAPSFNISQGAKAMFPLTF